jgi:putative spermidine/putrescine transport system substrate-binding protein
MSRRTKIAAVILGVAIVLGALFYRFFLMTPPSITAVTWSGAYGRAQASALFLPYQQRTGINVRIAEYDGGIAELRRRVMSKQYDWDVIDMELPDAIAACREGLLEPIDATTLQAGASGETPKTDFVANALGKCWVGSVVYSQLIAYSPTSFGNAHPIALKDFFDTARFPGPRALKGASAKFNLELALLADGIAPKNVYTTLSTPSGLDRAFRKLDTIRPSIVWWSRSSEPAAMLQDGRAVFATVLNGDVFDAAVHHHPLGTIWDGQLYELDVFGIPRGDPKREMAMDFVRFATSAPSLASVANWVPYGPARRSAIPLVGKNPELAIAMRPFLPTAPENFATAFAVNDEWWLGHGTEIAARWQAWRDR